MASLNRPTLLITVFSLTLATIATAQSSLSTVPHGSPASASLYDALKSNGLPIGLFPKGISDFSFDAATGRFVLRLLYPSPCDAQFETHVRYQCNITGSIGYGKIANLSGVAAQDLFLWLPVKGIQVDIPSSGLIYFDVGVVLKQFSLSFFETPKDCNALKENSGDDDVVVFFDDRDRGRFKSRSGKFMREYPSPTVQERRADA